MLSGTISHLDSRGYLRASSRANRPAIADAIIVMLGDRIVESDSLDEIQSKVPTVAEIRDEILGTTGDEDVDRELQTLVTGLLSVEGLVQQRLADRNGHTGDRFVLCASKVTREIDGDEGVQRSGRFISANPDVVYRHVYQPSMDKSVNDAERSIRIFDLCVGRIPSLEDRRTALIGTAKQRLALTLDTGVAS
jgi:hypothetical protein